MENMKTLSGTEKGQNSKLANAVTEIWNTTNEAAIDKTVVKAEFYRLVSGLDSNRRELVKDQFENRLLPEVGLQEKCSESSMKA